MSGRRFAGRAINYGGFRPVSALIEEQGDRYPDRPAVSYDGRTLSYRRLDALVSGLAGALAERGVRKGDVVPLLLVNSLEMPVAYLALMKLGAAFVPLDPDWPADRLRSALGVLPRGLVLTAAPETVPEEVRDRAMVVDVDRIAPAAVRWPTVPLAADDVVYGYFTSGTTGTPKCAMNLHGGLTNRLIYMRRYFGTPDGAEVVLQNSNHTFDSSLWQLFLPLITGGRCVLPVQGEFLNLQQTVETIAEHGVTAADFVSSVFNALATIVDGDEEALGKLATLRRLIVGSEPLNPDAVHRMMAQLPNLQVTNGYGPTETTIGMVFHPVSAGDGDAIPLGRPIDNCYAAVVDDDLRTVPPGTTGEIVIGGACMGQGYYGAPEATAKAFVPNPYPEEIPGDRLYRTGDLGHLDEEGRLFFAGRKDFQVKIGGVRIELGEIYNRSKWVGERHLAETRTRGALVTVLRLGEVMPSADNGSPNAVALSHLLVSAFVRLGLRPGVEIRSDYTPVDYAAARIVAAVCDRAVWGRTLNVLHPESVDYAAAFGVPAVPCGEFLARVREEAVGTGGRELTSLASLLPGRTDAAEDELRPVFAALLTDNAAMFHKDECRRLEDRWGLTDPPLDGAIAAYRNHLLPAEPPADPLDPAQVPAG